MPASPSFPWTLPTACVWCLCLALSISDSVLASELKWASSENLIDVLPSDVDMTSAVGAPSVITCAVYCSWEPWCNTFFYSEDSRDCLRHRMVYDAPENVTSASGWRYYKLITGGPAYFTDRLSGSHYRLDPLLVNDWDTSRNQCLAQGEDLVVLEPVVKARFIQDYFTTNLGLQLPKDIYIGAQRPNASVDFPPSGPDFMWVNGQFINMTATASFWVKWPVFDTTRDVLELRRNTNFTLSSGSRNGGKRFSLCEKPFLLS